MKPKRYVVGLNPFCEFGKFFILNSFRRSAPPASGAT